MINSVKTYFFPTNLILNTIFLFGIFSLERKYPFERNLAFEEHLLTGKVHFGKENSFFKDISCLERKYQLKKNLSFEEHLLPENVHFGKENSFFKNISYLERKYPLKQN